MVFESNENSFGYGNIGIINNGYFVGSLYASYMLRVYFLCYAITDLVNEWRMYRNTRL